MCTANNLGSCTYNLMYIQYNFIRFFIPPRAGLLPGIQISSSNLWRTADVRVLSIGETLGLVTEERGCIPAGHRGVMSTPGGRQMFSFTVRPSAFLFAPVLWNPSYLPEVKSTFCETHVLPGANVFGYF